MFRISYILTVVLVFGCSTMVVSTPQRKESQSILSALAYECRGNYKSKKLSDEAILRVRKAHSKWVKDSKDPGGHKANLCDADLPQGNFQEADLRSAVFRTAMLAGANFTKAILNKAELQGANLTGANLSEARLNEAYLDQAMLHLAILQKADLQKASLRHAMLYKANLQGANLKDVKGLTQSQINQACLDEHTELPKGLTRPKQCQELTPEPAKH